MKFFKPEEFFDMDPTVDDIAGYCNNKLEREARVLYAQKSDQRYWTDVNDPSTQYDYVSTDLKGYLIGIEPHNPCDHPFDQVRLTGPIGFGQYECIQCGIKMKPIAFEKIK